MNGEAIRRNVERQFLKFQSSSIKNDLAYTKVPMLKSNHHYNIICYTMLILHFNKNLSDTSLIYSRTLCGRMNILMEH